LSAKQTMAIPNPKDLFSDFREVPFPQRQVIKFIHTGVYFGYFYRLTSLESLRSGSCSLWNCHAPSSLR